MIRDIYFALRFIIREGFDEENNERLSIVIKNELNTDKLLTYPTKGIVMNQRELSKIMKSITTESYFDISDELSVELHPIFDYQHTQINGSHPVFGVNLNITF